MVVKICGLKTLEHARAAVEAGADLLGFVFAPSKRQVTAAQVRPIVEALRAHPGFAAVRTVGVFVNASAAQVNATLDAAGLDIAQLSGDEAPEAAVAISRPLLKALRLDGAAHEQRWLEDEGAAELLLVDASVVGSYGGAGVLADWSAAAALAKRRRLLLAGGLNPGNVVAALEAVQPFGVDVSSGVETDGVKDSTKIEAFVRAVRAAGRREHR